MEWYRIVLYIMMGVQMLAWLWMQKRGGELADISYIVFCFMMMTGQTGAAIECVLMNAWGTLAVQVYFFIFSAYGAFVRYRKMKKNEVQEKKEV